MFMRINSPICPECVKAEDISFQKLKEYLDEHPENSIAMVSRETGVPMKRILKYIQDGRIELSVGMAEDNPLTCTRCGCSIRIGTMCEECLTSYNQAVQGIRADAQNSKNTGTGMHTARPDDKKRR
jgi:hypothetical protein